MQLPHARKLMCLSVLVAASALAPSVRAEPEVAPACRVVDRVSLPHAAIASFLPAETRIELDGVLAFRTGDVTSFFPELKSYRHTYLRVAGGKLEAAADFGEHGADAFMLAGRAPAEQLLGLAGGGTGASLSLYDRNTGALESRRDISRTTLHWGLTMEVAAAPARDGLRSVFAIGNRVIGPFELGVAGVDAELAAPLTRICEGNTKVWCSCFNVLPTQTAGTVSLMEHPDSGSSPSRWRAITLDETGRVRDDVSVPMPLQTVPQVAGCPRVARGDRGLVALVRLNEGTRLVHLDDPEHPVPLTVADGSAMRSIVDVGFAGSNTLLVERGESLSVVRAVAGRIEAASRLTFSDAKTELSFVSTDGPDAVLHYGTETSREIVTVSCR